MFTKEKKVEGELKIGKTKSRLLRLFRSNAIPSGSLVTLERTGREDAHSVNTKSIGNALLDAEYQNARALLAFQKNERFH